MKKGEDVMSDYPRRALEYMPFDKTFYVDGQPQLCHASGDEVFLDGEWWTVYLDDEGEEHYGR